MTVVTTNILYFVRHEHKSRLSSKNIVHLVTAITGEAAATIARNCISDFCRADYHLSACEAVCTTADTIEPFEPV